MRPEDLARPLAFCPLSINPEDVTTVTVGKTFGILVTQFPNGDAIVRTEEGFWSVPEEAFKRS